MVIQTGEKLADDPLVLLNFSADRKSSLVEGRVMAGSSGPSLSKATVW